MTPFKLGSLFDGSGAFPFAASMCGLIPAWASEIEEFPIKLTSKRFPEMKHLGDIKEINGTQIEPVDVISFGSPCQGLSIAGKMKGLKDERSGLFLEAIRVIKEMKNDTGYPRFILWENVPGAFRSNNGADFQEVLSEITKICDGNVSVPESPIGADKKQKWPSAGLIMGDNFSIAWRVLDAQFWGVPQRRRRIFLVGDLGGHSAGKILFVREGLPRNFASVRREWEEYTSPFDYSASETGRPLIKIKSESVIDFGNSFGGCTVGKKAPTLTANMERESKNVPCVFDISQRRDGIRINEGISQTITAFAGTGGNNVPVIESNARLRRLMPHECAKLQGMPSWWCADVKHADAAEYKMWGNGVALPCALYVFEGIALELFKNWKEEIEIENYECFSQYQQETFAKLKKADISPTLRACGGNHGGGSEIIIAQTDAESIN